MQLRQQCWMSHLQSNGAAGVKGLADDDKPGGLAVYEAEGGERGLLALKVSLTSWSVWA